MIKKEYIKNFEVQYSGVEEAKVLYQIFKTLGERFASYLDESCSNMHRINENYFYFDKNMNYVRTDSVTHSDIQNLKQISFKDFVKLVKSNKIYKPKVPKWKAVWKDS